MSSKLPKHIAQMVEKNNLVMAIKTLAEEQGIDMGAAKQQIDDYENLLKQQHAMKADAIVAKQEKKHKNKLENKRIKKKPALKDKSHLKTNSMTQDSATPDSLASINDGLDKRLNDIGYKPPLVPYWMKRLFIILLITALLSFLVWRLVL